MFKRFYCQNIEKIFNNTCIGGDLVRGLGGRGQRVSAEKKFLPSPPKCEILGDGGGLTVFVNFNI